jgi:hypothetical protein
MIKKSIALIGLASAAVIDTDPGTQPVDPS